MSGDPAFEELLAGYSEFTRNYVHSMMAATPETYHVYIMELVARVRRETVDEIQAHYTN